MFGSEDLASVDVFGPSGLFLSLVLGAQGLVTSFVNGFESALWRL